MLACPGIPRLRGRRHERSVVWRSASLLLPCQSSVSSRHGKSRPISRPRARTGFPKVRSLYEAYMVGRSRATRRAWPQLSLESQSGELSISHGPFAPAPLWSLSRNHRMRKRIRSKGVSGSASLASSRVHNQRPIYARDGRKGSYAAANHRSQRALKKTVPYVVSTIASGHRFS